jgi:hypothetical protein
MFTGVAGVSGYPIEDGLPAFPFTQNERLMDFLTLYLVGLLAEIRHPGIQTLRSQLMRQTFGIVAIRK